MCVKTCLCNLFHKKKTCTDCVYFVVGAYRLIVGQMEY